MTNWWKKDNDGTLTIFESDSKFWGPVITIAFAIIVIASVATLICLLLDIKWWLAVPILICLVIIENLAHGLWEYKKTRATSNWLVYKIILLPWPRYCDQCHQRMINLGMEHRDPNPDDSNDAGEDTRTYKCPKCDHEKKI